MNTSEHDQAPSASRSAVRPGCSRGTTRPSPGGCRRRTPWLGPLDGSMVVLDVACGAGHVAEQVAPEVRQVVGVDLTPELLALGAARLREAGVANVLLQRGAAADLPFLDESFDVVCCRSALHHFGEPARRGGGDGPGVPPDRPGGGVRRRRARRDAVRDAYDAVHRALDPSHGRAFTAEEVVDLLATHVGPVGSVEQRGPGALPLDAIMTEVADADAVRAALEQELAGGPPTGFLPAARRRHPLGLVLQRGSPRLPALTRPCPRRGPPIRRVSRPTGPVVPPCSELTPSPRRRPPARSTRHSPTFGTRRNRPPTQLFGRVGGALAVLSSTWWRRPASTERDTRPEPRRRSERGRGTGRQVRWRREGAS